MKRIRFILLAAVLLAVITLPAFGANENPNKGSLPVITGQITDVSEDFSSFGLTDYWEDYYTFNIDDATRCVEKTVDESGETINKNIDCAGILVGDFASVQYVEDFLAIRVNVDADFIHFTEPSE